MMSLGIGKRRCGPPARRHASNAALCFACMWSAGSLTNCASDNATRLTLGVRGDPRDAGAVAASEPGVADTGTTASSSCGDGTLQAGEECDDGNLAFGDGCTPECRQELCGNGRVDAPSEECDPPGTPY